MRIIERLIKPGWRWFAGSGSYPEVEGLEQELRARDLTIEQLRAQLTIANEWRVVVTDALVVNWAYRADHEHDPRQAVRDLVAQEIFFALDPTISLQAKALVEQGVAQATQNGGLA